MEKILVTNPSYDYYFELGKQYGEKIDKSGKRIAVIASADLSHVLKSDGPYGIRSGRTQTRRINCNGNKREKRKKSVRDE